MPRSEELATNEDLARLCQVPKGTIYRWNHLGIGPRSIKVGKHTRYRWSDIDAWLDARANTPSAS